MRIRIVNLGKILTGNWREPFTGGDTIVTDGGKIESVGTWALYLGSSEKFLVVSFA